MKSVLFVGTGSHQRRAILRGVSSACASSASTERAEVAAGLLDVEIE